MENGSDNNGKICIFIPKERPLFIGGDKCRSDTKDDSGRQFARPVYVVLRPSEMIESLWEGAAGSNRMANYQIENALK